jgi:hypothetical protein
MHKLHSEVENVFGVINTSVGTLFNLSKGLGVEIAEFFKTEN